MYEEKYEKHSDAIAWNCLILRSKVKGSELASWTNFTSEAIVFNEFSLLPAFCWSYQDTIKRFMDDSREVFIVHLCELYLVVATIERQLHR